MSEKEKEENEVFWECYDDFCDFIKTKTNATVLRNARTEADDLIARWIDKHPDEQHVIISTDKDLNQLVAHNVKQYNGVTEVTLTNEGWFDAKGNPVIDKKLKAPKPAPNTEWMIFEKAMRGDPSDNIFSAYPGVRTKGTKNKIGLQEAFADRKEKGYTTILEDMHEGLKSQARRENRASSKGKTSIQNLGNLLVNEQRSNRLLQGNFGVLDRYESLFLDILKTDTSVVLSNAGEADEVVTIDVRRQIRWPTSLHGKSGLRVTEFPLSRLDPDGSRPFDPLSETIALPNTNSLSVEITQEDCRFRFFESEWEPNSGDIIDVPEATATFLTPLSLKLAACA